MKRLLKIFYVGLAGVILLGSCEEIYVPKEIHSPAKVPVIQGSIFEGENPKVTISWAPGYYADTQEYISGAIVYVTNDLGDSVKLDEFYGGYYTAYSSSIIGEEGRTYVLKVELPDKSRYSSVPVLLPQKPSIDSLYANPGYKTIFTYDVNNVPTPFDMKGLYILADLSANTDSLQYFRFNTKVVKEMVYTVGVSTPGSFSVYLWESSMLDNSYSVDFSVMNDAKQILREHQIGFVDYFYDPSQEVRSGGPDNTLINTAPYTVGWIVTCKVYSISRDVYNYYNSIAKEENSKDQIFAPLPSQVLSNIHCLNDPGKPVIGVFEASSVTTRYKAFGWKSVAEYYSKNLSFFPDYINNGRTNAFPPDFWITF